MHRKEFHQPNTAGHQICKSSVNKNEKRHIDISCHKMCWPGAAKFWVCVYMDAMSWPFPDDMQPSGVKATRYACRVHIHAQGRGERGRRERQTESERKRERDRERKTFSAVPIRNWSRHMPV